MPPYFIRTVALTVIVLLTSTGCRICSDSEDLAYPSYGGAWQRTVRDSGRVGSLFDPAGARSSMLVSRDSTITADELERSRREPSEEKPDNLFDESDPAESDPQSDEDSSGTDSSPLDNEPQGELDVEPNLRNLDEDVDPALQDKIRQLREEDLEDIKVIPGDALPPLLR